MSRNVIADAGRFDFEVPIRRIGEFANGDNLMPEPLLWVPDTYGFEQLTPDISSTPAEGSETSERISTTTARGPNQGGPARDQPSHSD